MSMKIAHKKIQIMAVFLLNTCKFNGCGRSFSHLGELILHIEEKHIDYDPRAIEQKEQQQPTCLPLSYILRFYSDAARKEYPRTASPPRTPSKTITTSLNTPVNPKSPSESDLDEDEAASESGEDSDDSWTTPEEFSSEFILKEGSKSASNNVGEDRPFVCPVPGCKKRYKNVNGIKYHAKNGHKKDSGKIRKAHRCPCGKKYRTVVGLKTHTQVAHQASPDGVKTLPVRTSSLAVLDQSFTLVAKGRQGNVVQLGIITPNHQSSQSSTTLTLTPITQKSTQ
ncbi:juxtaposed with another zinc finger protein 1 [Neocloeon triangulifer]|uniref:juxtaposed with another zinc finger protein 1 n=1 Tax=Neocloeon triangulifer TaxID=2078957 RepID=UPI00286F63B0|nr:juxtaposed with another zinc finger protein 1 [Neocloeon triangulifer]